MQVPRMETMLCQILGRQVEQEGVERGEDNSAAVREVGRIDRGEEGCGCDEGSESWKSTDGRR